MGGLAGASSRGGDSWGGWQVHYQGGVIHGGAGRCIVKGGDSWGGWWVHHQGGEGLAARDMLSSGGCVLTHYWVVW